MARSNPPLTQRVRRRARAAAAGAERGAGAAADLDRAAAGRVGPDASSSWCRPRASSRRPTRSRSATASAACASSARWTGASSSRPMSVVEQHAARGSGRHLRRDGFRHARPLSARGRADRAHAARSTKPRWRARRVDAGAQTRAGEPATSDRAAHVGYYLIDDGLRAARAGAGVARAAWRRRCARAPARVAAAGLLPGPIALIVGLLTAGWCARRDRDWRRTAAARGWSALLCADRRQPARAWRW